MVRIDGVVGPHHNQRLSCEDGTDRFIRITALRLDTPRWYGANRGYEGPSHDTQRPTYGETGVDVTVNPAYHR